MSQLVEGDKSCPLRAVPHTPSLQIWEILVRAGSYPACPWGAPRLPYGGSSREILSVWLLPLCNFVESCKLFGAGCGPLCVADSVVGVMLVLKSCHAPNTIV